MNQPLSPMFTVLRTGGIRNHDRACGLVAAALIWLIVGVGQVTADCRYESVEAERTARAEASRLASVWSGDAIRQAIALSVELFDCREAPDADEYVRLLDAGWLSYRLGDFRQTAELADRVVVGGRDLNDFDLIVGGLALRSSVELRVGNADGSERSFSDGIGLFDSTTKPASKAAILSAGADLRYFKGQTSESIDFGRRAVEFWEQAKDPLRGAESAQTLGYSLILDDQTELAKSAIDNAMALARSANSERAVAFVSIQKGMIHYLAGEYQNALSICLNAEKAFPDDMDTLELARLHNSIGSIYEVYGDWPSALDHSRRALEMFRRASYPIGELATLPSLMKLTQLAGDPQTIEPYYERAVTLSRQLNESLYLANARISLADYYQSTGEIRKSIGLYDTAISLFQSSNHDVGVATAQHKLAKILLKTGDLGRAETVLRKSLNHSLRTKEAIAISELYFDLAKIESRRNNLDLALTAIEKSITSTEAQYADITSSKLKSLYLSNAYERYELYVDLLMRKSAAGNDHDLVRKALQIAERSRARSGLQNIQLAEAGAFGDGDPELIKREAELRTKLGAQTQKLTQRLTQNGSTEEIQAIEAARNDLENQWETIKGELKLRSPVYSQFRDPSAFDIGSFQSEILDESTVLLEYSLGLERSYLWVVEKNRLDAYPLPSRTEIESPVIHLRELLTERDLRDGENGSDYRLRLESSERQYDLESAQLSRVLFGPVAERIAGKRLVIVADGKLQSFPLGALPAPDSATGDPILVSSEVVYEPSASMLQAFKNRSKQSTSGGRILILSDPLFATGAGGNAKTAEPGLFRSVTNIDQLSRLPSSMEEARLIAEMFSQTDVFSGPSANRSNLLGMNLRDYSVLHFATHGIADEQRPELSGIVLSRLNERSEEQDAVVRLHDVYGLSLNSDLVTISACNSGIGKELRGEGLMSLNSAFLQAGSKTVVSSLWKVDDTATMRLMSEFYRAIRDEKLPPSQALRRAQLALARDPAYRSPFFWGAFVAHGDYESLPSVASAASYKPVVVGIAIIAALAAFFGFRRFISR